MFNISPELALAVYEDTKRELDALLSKQAVMRSNGIDLPELETLIQRRKRELEACAKYAFGDNQ